jgi:hypothetical protein
MRGVGFDFEAAPLDSDGDDGALLRGEEGGDDDVGGSGGIFGLYLHVESGAGVDVYSGGEAECGLLSGLLAEEAFQHLH